MTIRDTHALPEDVAGSVTDVEHLRHLVRGMFDLTQRLSASAPGPEVHQLIVRLASDAVGATQGSLAVFAREDGCLHVSATVGYPDVLVRHIRIVPGESVVGRVFSTGRPLLVGDIREHPELHPPRLRYRGSSFIAAPIPGSSGPLGVLCLTDRADGRVFVPDDLSIVRCLAAGSAVALRATQAADEAAVLQQWATTDPVTGLFNRRFFEQRLDEEIERARRYGRPLSLLLLDLDDLKQINDTFGHATGDAALRVVSLAIRHAVRASDICCRYGGDEFALLLPDSDAADALASAHRLRDAVERQCVTALQGTPAMHVTISVGVATHVRGQGAAEFVDSADGALYEAKASGKQCVRAARTRSVGISR